MHDTIPDSRTAPVGTGADVEAVGLGRRFAAPGATVDALREVDLRIPAGEFCVIVGPSGCGKSTLLRILAGLDMATSGNLHIQRTDGSRPSNAVVFQGRSLFPWLTAGRNIAYGLELQGVARSIRDTTAETMLGVLGLDGFANAYPHQISEGMRQRVAIGRALAVDPDLLLMDEPFGALDEQTRYILQEELLRIWERTGKTIVFVTHSIEEAITLGDRIIIMSARPGRVRQVVDLPFQRPRNIRSIRSDAAYGEIFGIVWDALRDEVVRSRSPLAGRA